jgi:sugar lactone lactonase YvrE
MAGARLARTVAGAAAAIALAAPAAHAHPTCATGATPVQTLASGQGSLESVIVDEGGRVFYTSHGRRALLRLDPGSTTPVVVAANAPELGGLAWADDGDLLVGSGTTIPKGLIGNVFPLAQILKIDPDTGARSLYARGLAMANGLARGPDGSIYASDDVGLGIDRVFPGGRVHHFWALVLSPNGIAVSPDGNYLYAAQTFVPAAIARVNLGNRRVSTYTRPGLADIAAGYDGMDIDDQGRLFVAANVSGEIVRADPGKAPCRVAAGLTNASAVAVHGDDVYAVGFSGRLIRLPGAAG